MAIALIATAILVLIVALRANVPNSRKSTVYLAGHHGVGKSTLAVMLIRLGSLERLGAYKISPSPVTNKSLAETYKRLLAGLPPETSSPDAPRILETFVERRYSRRGVARPVDWWLRLRRGRISHTLRIVDSTGWIADPQDAASNRETMGASPPTLRHIEDVSSGCKVVYVLDAGDMLRRPERVRYALEEIQQIRLATKFNDEDSGQAPIFLAITKLDCLEGDALRNELISRLRRIGEPPISGGHQESGFGSWIDRIVELRDNHTIQPHVAILSPLSLAAKELDLDIDIHELRVRGLHSFTSPEADRGELAFLLGMLLGDRQVDKSLIRKVDAFTG